MVLRRKLYIQILKYFAQLKIAVHEIPAVIGFCIFLVLVSQLFSGVMMSFSIIPEPMYVSLEREVEDCENVYQDDFTLLHERGVDLLMILLYLHLCRKSYICSCNVEQEVA
jgi:hypothetical protein